MTEKEKAQAGYLYNANYDEEIIADIDRCNDLCFELNQFSDPLLHCENKKYNNRDYIRNRNSAELCKYCRYH